MYPLGCFKYGIADKILFPLLSEHNGVVGIKLEPHIGREIGCMVRRGLNAHDLAFGNETIEFSHALVLVFIPLSEVFDSQDFGEFSYDMTGKHSIRDNRQIAHFQKGKECETHGAAESEYHRLREFETMVLK